MAKTYTITSSSMNAGRASSLATNWTGFQTGEAAGLVTGYSSAGYSSAFYRAVNILFNSSDLNQFSSKTITSIKLRITVSSGTLGSTSYPYRVRYKYNNETTTASSGSAWASGVAAGGTYSSTNIASWSNGQSSGTTTITANSTHDFDVGTTLPAYGYVIAGVTGNAYMTLASTATLIITTNETDYTLKLSYNSNGGSGSVAQQSATVTTSGTPSKTFTVNPSSTAVTKTGHTFLGWSTSSTATSAAYQNGGSITISSNTTLYAVWKANTYTVSYNKGSYGTGTNSTATKTYNVTLTLKGAQFTRTGYEQNGWATSDGGSAVYSLGGSYTTNASVTLYPAWKATTSTITASNGTIGTAQTITITRYSSSYKHTLTYKYGSATGTIGTNLDTSVSWTPPASLASQFPSAKSGTCTLTCETFSGSTSLGKTSISITLTIPSSIKCTVSSVALAETVSGLNAKFGAFVQNKSKVSVTGTTSTSSAQGATVSSYTITINGQTLTTNGAITNLIASSGSPSYSFKITDTRGYTDTETGNYTVLPYSNPTASISAQRDSTTSSTINVSYSWNISPCSNLNDKSINIKYKILGGSWETASTITPSSYSGADIATITGTDDESGYDVCIEVTDYFTTVSAQTAVSSLGNRILSISHADQTIAFHGDSPADGWDHQYFKERFHDDVQFDSDATIFGYPMSRGLLYKGIASDVSTDFDDIQTAGIYALNGTTMTNAPSVYTWSYLIVMANTSNALVYQLLVRQGSTAPYYLFCRYLGGNPPTWSSWLSPYNTSYGDLSQTGTTLSVAPSAVSVATATWKTVASIDLPAGRWVIFANARFASNATGYREILMSTNADDGVQTGYIFHDIRGAVNGTYTYCSFSCWRNLSATSTTQYLNVYQNSGSALNVIGRMYAVRIA